MYLGNEEQILKNYNKEIENVIIKVLGEALNF